MSTEIVRAAPAHSQALSLGIMSARDAWLFCESLAKANILPPEYRGNPGSVLWALEYGRALGLDVVTTITTIHVIKGKPTQSADLMLSRARAAGHKVRVRPENERCVVSIWRSDDPDFENRTEWTLDDARKAQLYPGKPDSNWAKYTRSMLRARAISECVRSACPEVLHGAIYTPEEVGAYVDQEGNPVDAPVQPLRVVPSESAMVVDAAAFTPHLTGQGLADKAKDATSKAAVKALWAEAAEIINVGVLAPDTGEPEVLGAYLTRLANSLPDHAPQASKVSPVVDAEIVEDDERTAAVNALRGAALAAGVAATIEQDFKQSYGVPIAAASVAQLAEMTQLLVGAA